MNSKYIQNLLEYDWSSKVTYRIKLLNEGTASNWDKFLIVPTEGYLEVSSGPIAFSKVEYIEINPFEERYVGKLVPNKVIDHSAEIKDALDLLDISFIYTESSFKLPIKN